MDRLFLEFGMFFSELISFAIITSHIIFTKYLIGWDSWRPLKGVVTFSFLILLSFFSTVFVIDMLVYSSVSILTMFLFVITASLMITLITDNILKNRAKYCGHATNGLLPNLLQQFRNTDIPLDGLLNQWNKSGKLDLVNIDMAPEGLWGNTRKLVLGIIYMIPTLFISVAFSNIYTPAMSLLSEQLSDWVPLSWEYFLEYLGANSDLSLGSVIAVGLGFLWIVLYPLSGIPSLFESDY
jgi:hypothetical protein